jgi:hypothetical protein
MNAVFCQVLSSSHGYNVNALLYLLDTTVGRGGLCCWEFSWQQLQLEFQLSS